MRSYGKICDDLAEVDVVDRDVIRSEVRHIQAGVIERNHAASRLSADKIAARYFVARGLDDGDAAGVEVESDQFPAVRFQRETHWRFSDIKERKQLVVFEINTGNLARSRTGHERLAGIRQDGDVLGMDADGDGGTHGEARGIDNGDGVIGAIGDNYGGSVGRDAGESGTSADMKRSRDSTTVEIKHRNIGGPGIGNVGAVAVRRNIDEEGASVDADGCDDFILLRVNHADVIRPGVNDVNFVSLWIGRNSGRLGTSL